MEWKTKGLDEVLFIQEGPGIRKYEYEDGGYPMINVRCVQDGYVDMSKSRSANYELATTKWKHFQVEENDILYTISGTIGRSAIVKKSDLPLLMNTSVVRFRSLTEFLDTKFVYYAFKTETFIKELLGYSTGTAIKNVGPSHLKKMAISYPPISEQKRIVALLDTIFADLEQTRAKTEQNLKNARELFDSYLQQVFSQKGEGWVDGKMTDICEINTKLIDPKEDEYLELLHIGAGNIVSNTGEIIKLQTAKEEGLISGKFVFDNSMILYSKIRPYLMKVCRPEFTGLCSADIYPLSPIKEVMDKDFLFYLLLSKDFTDYAISGSGRAGMPKVNRTHLFNYSVSIPPIEKQREFIIKINQVASQSQDLERIYKSKLVTIDELKKSILQKAFSGELTTSAK
ncbi:restriction endonuclease subunit S [Photobacterium aquimaris]|uniref:Restriction endonuclease subunit S n=1 Tax=Photobacterium aquimaris TaxID=512643 RepID=A0A2T3HTY2_9GAMM|nr:restriction endonuclease subunit S [Photobacterium aquimaris]OBU24350.1 hypothetical protein AYY21_02240 [Photobacterium aquimaris]PQJ40462.1 hypothetical protein BTN98_01945 [Photobacterium aquimaris]PST99334.1 restriction endonuclease subunit S [Photobacterium aquimaris]